MKEKALTGDFDAVIIGAGASGMMAAVTALWRGKNICIIEQGPEPGRKLLRTGNGRCNITHEDVKASDYPRVYHDFLSEAFRVFGYDQTIRVFKNLGVITKNKEGYLYPYSGTALSVRNALWDEIKGLGGHIYTFTRAKRVKAGSAGGYTVEAEDTKTGEKKIFISGSVILAAGSKSAPKTGSDGSGYKLAESLGLNINTVHPGLVKLLSDDRACRMAAGVRHVSKVDIYTDGELKATDTGEVQFAKDGISGIPVFQVSREAVRGLAAGKKVEAVLDLFPDLAEEEISGMLKNAAKTKGSRTLTNFWGGLLCSGLSAAVADKISLSSEKKIHQIPAEKLKTFAVTAGEFRIKITGDNGFESAQICTGGVDTGCIDPGTMMVKSHPGLYCVGEIADIDGPCGGYNLQWAWTSGAIAGSKV